MKLDEFVSTALTDIENGLKKAREVTGKKSFVRTETGEGVNFDVAVTVSSSVEGGAEGSAKIGLIQVLGVNASGKVNGKTEKSEVSRIKFNVFVPARTEKEDRDLDEQIDQQNLVHKDLYL